MNLTKEQQEVKDRVVAVLQINRDRLQMVIDEIEADAFTGFECEWTRTEREIILDALRLAQALQGVQSIEINF